MHPDAYAVEVGPYAAAYVNGLLNSPDRDVQMRERERAHPASMAFLNDEQENNLAATCAASTRTRTSVCGGSIRSLKGQLRYS
jgi:hypothetical protein